MDHPEHTEVVDKEIRALNDKQISADNRISQTKTKEEHIERSNDNTLYCLNIVIQIVCKQKAYIRYCVLKRSVSLQVSYSFLTSSKIDICHIV